LSSIEQTEVVTLRHGLKVLERLNSLHREYDEVSVQILHPFDLTDFEMLKERRQTILHEARKLARMLNISEPEWASLSN
jgi:hypothetical protein